MNNELSMSSGALLVWAHKWILVVACLEFKGGPRKGVGCAGLEAIGVLGPGIIDWCFGPSGGQCTQGGGSLELGSETR